MNDIVTRYGIESHDTGRTTANPPAGAYANYLISSAAANPAVPTDFVDIAEALRRFPATMRGAGWDAGGSPWHRVEPNYAGDVDWGMHPDLYDRLAYIPRPSPLPVGIDGSEIVHEIVQEYTTSHSGSSGEEKAAARAKAAGTEECVDLDLDLLYGDEAGGNDNE